MIVGAELLRSLKDVNLWDLPWDEERSVFEAIGRRHVGCVGEEGNRQADALFELAFVEMVRQAPRQASLRHDQRPWTDYHYAVTLLRLASEVSGYRWRCFEFMFDVLEKHFAWFPHFVVQAINLSLSLETGTLLQFLEERGLYAAQREHLYLYGQTVVYPLHEVGNARACKQLLGEGHDPLVVNGQDQTALVAAAVHCRPFACPMGADALGKQGVLRVLLSRCDVEPLLQPRVCSAVLEVILERRADAFARLSPVELLRGCVEEYHGAGRLPELIRMMILFKQHGVQPPVSADAWIRGALDGAGLGQHAHSSCSVSSMRCRSTHAFRLSSRGGGHTFCGALHGIISIPVSAASASSF